MKILITGSAGFVGRHFLRRFITDDITRIDIRDPFRQQDAREFFRTDTSQFDLVVHLAAVVGGRVNIESNPLGVAVDLSIDAELFNWAIRMRPKRIIYYSSSAAYPIDLQQGYPYQLTEDDIDLDYIATPDLTYGWAKLSGEMLARHAEQAGLRVHVFRPFSGYGEDQEPSYPFPKFIERAQRRDDPFTIWGDGQQVRDFIHIDDVVNATLEAVKQDVPGPVNLGWGRATDFNELARMVSVEAGYRPQFRHVESAPQGVRYRVCDPSKMLSFYQPKISLEEGVRRALRG